MKFKSTITDLFLIISQFLFEIMIKKWNKLKRDENLVRKRKARAIHIYKIKTENFLIKNCKNLREINKKCINGRESHKHRKHRSQPRFFVMENRRRMKRNINFEKIVEFTAENSPHYILTNITIHAEQTLKIYPGTDMIFSQNTGITAHGKAQRIHFSSFQFFSFLSFSFFQKLKLIILNLN